jgi:hypothetical protein
MTPANGSPAGLYYSKEFPLLSCLTSVCCGIKSERELFSKTGAYWAYCSNRYGMSDEQTQVLIAAAANPMKPGHDCVPTSEQLDAIVKALETELKNAAIPKTHAPAREALEPALEKLYPTLSHLYRSLVLGESARPHDWHSKLRAEFDRASVVW